MSKKFFKSGQRKKSNTVGRAPAFFQRTKVWSIFALALIAVSGLGYLGLVNYKATVGFKISDLEIKIEQLKEINQKMQMEKIELQKISRIQEAAKKINMTIAVRTEYLQAGDDGLALR